MSDIEKFSYLKGKLQGQAQSAISGLTLSNENYEVAVDILKERFRDVQTVVDIHYFALINFPQVTNRTTDLRMIYDKIEQNLRSLEALQQNIDQDVFISMITTKLPKEVLVQLEIQKDGVKWSVRKLRHLFKGCVLAREAAESQAKDRNSEIKSPTVHVFSNTKYRQPLIKPYTPRTTSEALMSSTPNRALTFNRGEANKICIYCKSTHHWSDECEMCKTVDERKLHGLWFICLKTGHRLKDCKSERKCVYCGKSKKHHRSLCLKKFPINAEMSSLPEDVVETPNENEGTLLSSGDTVLMQTAKTVVHNLSKPKTEEIRLLLDSGSQRTYITKALGRKLNLKFVAVEQVSIVTFGSDKPQTVRIPKVTLKMKLPDGNFMTIDANVVAKVTGTVLRRPVKIKKCQNWECLWSKFSLADTLPVVNETSTIELLIANDYYLDII